MRLVTDIKKSTISEHFGHSNRAGSIDFYSTNNKSIGVGFLNPIPSDTIIIMFVVDYYGSSSPVFYLLCDSNQTHIRP